MIVLLPIPVILIILMDLPPADVALDEVRALRALRPRRRRHVPEPGGGHAWGCSSGVKHANTASHVKLVRVVTCCSMSRGGRSRLARTRRDRRSRATLSSRPPRRAGRGTRGSRSRSPCFRGPCAHSSARSLSLYM